MNLNSMNTDIFVVQDVFLSSSNFSCLDRGSSKRSQETCPCRGFEVKGSHCILETSFS